MRTSLSTGLLSAALAAAILAPGCRTINRTPHDRVTADDIPFETSNQRSRIARSTTPVVEAPVVEAPVVKAPVVEEPVVEAPDVDTPVVDVPAPKPAPKPVAKPADKAVLAPPATLEPVTAKRPEMDTAPYEAKVVKSADQVGKPGSYVERVIPEDGGDKPVPVELDGLSGSTGRHVPAPAPAPEPVPVVKPAPADSGWYVVQAGDILGRIAQKHGVSQKALLDANPGLKDPNRIRIGQKLNVPPRGTGLGASAPKKGGAKKPAAPKKAATLPPKAGYTVYVVQPGDILGRIANRNKTTVKALQEANGIADPTKLRAGTPIYVPSASAPAPAAPKPAVEEVSPPPAASAPAEDDVFGSSFDGTFGL